MREGSAPAVVGHGRSVGLVVPVFNEAERLGEFVGALVDFIDAQPQGSRLCFVDDGSTDSTVRDLEARLEALASPNVELIRRPHQGKGAAVSAGIRHSTAEVVGFCDLDLSTPLPDLEQIIDVGSGSDVLAIGSRDVLGSVIAKPQDRVREALGRSYNRLLQASATPGIVDTQCGAKAASSGVWRALLPHCRQVGFAWDAELIAVALARGIAVQEIPITWRHDDRSKVHVMRDGIAMLRETPRIVGSARRAATTPPIDLTEQRIAGSSEVFDPVNAERIEAVDRTHWWFRSKAAFVVTALRRTADAHDGDGWLMDVGGGAGGVCSMLGWPPDRLLLLEGNRALVETAQRRRGLEALQGSARTLPVADGAVEVVTLLDVIEHLDDAGAALREAARVLRPGGRLVVNVPAHEWLWSRADEELGHRRRYTRRSLRAELDSAGFEPLLLTHVFSWLVPPVWVVRQLARPGGQAELGLEQRSAAIDVASLVLTSLERCLLGRATLPFGTSIICVARPRIDSVEAGVSRA